PRARPLTITTPDAASSRPSIRATWAPYGEHARAPTIATEANESRFGSAFPRRYRRRGGSWIARKSGGSPPRGTNVMKAALPGAGTTAPRRRALTERPRSRRAPRSSGQRARRAHDRVRTSRAARPRASTTRRPQCYGAAESDEADRVHRTRAREQRPTAP